MNEGAGRSVLSALGPAIGLLCERTEVVGYLTQASMDTDDALPSLSVGDDDRTIRPDDARVSAVSLPGLPAGFQRAHWHGAQPGPGSDRHRVSGGAVAPPLQAQPAGPSTTLAVSPALTRTD